MVFITQNVPYSGTERPLMNSKYHKTYQAGQDDLNKYPYNIKISNIRFNAAKSPENSLMKVNLSMNA